MSGVPIIGKVFKDIEKGVKHAIKEIDKNPVLKAVVVAAVVYFTVGAAVEYFSATAATGAATAGVTTQSAMLASQTAAFGVEGAALTAEALAFAPGATGAVAAEVLAAAGPSAGTVGTAGMNAAPTASTTATDLAALEKSSVAADAVAGSNAGGVGGWIEANPMQATLLGQAGIGAASGYAAGEEAKNARNDRRGEEDRAREERLNRGLFGFDRAGNYGSGIVSSAMQQPSAPPPQAMQPPVNAATNPIVASQQVAQIAPIAAPKVAVQRTDLPKLNLQR